MAPEDRLKTVRRAARLPRKNRMALLRRAGIVDRDGKLTKRFWGK